MLLPTFDSFSSLISTSNDWFIHSADVFFRSNFPGRLFWCPFSLMVFFLFRLLQNKPEAAQKALSDNSLLKNIDFNEKFLGEEHIAESEIF